MLDMLTCMAIYNGTLVEKPSKKNWTYEEAIALR